MSFHQVVERMQTKKFRLQLGQTFVMFALLLLIAGIGISSISIAARFIFSALSLLIYGGVYLIVGTNTYVRGD